MDYTNYKIEDFATNESFVDWVYKSDPEAIKFWNLYFSEHPEVMAIAEQARNLVLNLQKAEARPQDEAQIDAMWEKITNRVEAQPKSAQRISHITLRPLAIVALVLTAVAGLSWFIFRPFNTNFSPTTDLQGYQRTLPGYQEQVNTTSKPINVKLADGSMVTLEPKARLRYKTGYAGDSTREVYLLGEAFFEVAPNPFKPFIVHANEVFTKVLGTSFRIAAPEDGTNIVVSVKTGKVSVYTLSGSGDKKDGVILLPNQQVNYERADLAFDKKLIDTPEILNTTITEADFKFDNTPIARVFKTIEKAYGVEIIFNPETMKHCSLTAPMGSESLQDKMAVICKTIGATYEVIDAKIVVSSTGCQP
jgi:transmembrane sensor